MPSPMKAGEVRQSAGPELVGGVHQVRAGGEELDAGGGRLAVADAQVGALGDLLDLGVEHGLQRSAGSESALDAMRRPALLGLRRTISCAPWRRTAAPARGGSAPGRRNRCTRGPGWPALTSRQTVAAIRSRGRRVGHRAELRADGADFLAPHRAHRRGEAVALDHAHVQRMRDRAGGIRRMRQHRDRRASRAATENSGPFEPVSWSVITKCGRACRAAHRAGLRSGWPAPASARPACRPGSAAPGGSAPAVPGVRRRPARGLSVEQRGGADGIGRQLRQRHLHRAAAAHRNVPVRARQVDVGREGARDLGLVVLVVVVAGGDVRHRVGVAAGGQMRHLAEIPAPWRRGQAPSSASPRSARRCASAARRRRTGRWRGRSRNRRAAALSGGTGRCGARRSCDRTARRGIWRPARG